MPIPLALIAGGASLASALLGNRAAGKQAKAQQAALDFEKEKWGAGQSFRDAGQQLLSRQVNPDAINQIYGDAGNPYSSATPYVNPWTAGSPVTSSAPSEPAWMTQARGSKAFGGLLGKSLPPTPSHAEPDSDQQGGPSDADADNMRGGMGGGMDPQRARLAAMAELLAPRRGGRARGAR